jgi:hypothetical protein
MLDSTITLLSLVAAGSSGWLASWLFDQARTALPRPTRSQWQQSRPLQRLAWRMLYHPRVAQLVNLALASLLGFAASVAAAWLSGEDLRAAVEAAVNAFFLAPALSYVRHRHARLAPRTRLQEDAP